MDEQEKDAGETTSTTAIAMTSHAWETSTVEHLQITTSPLNSQSSGNLEEEVEHLGEKNKELELRLEKYTQKFTKCLDQRKCLLNTVSYVQDQERDKDKVIEHLEVKLLEIEEELEINKMTVTTNEEYIKKLTLDVHNTQENIIEMSDNTEEDIIIMELKEQLNMSKYQEGEKAKVIDELEAKVLGIEQELDRKNDTLVTNEEIIKGLTMDVENTQNSLIQMSDNIEQDSIIRELKERLNIMLYQLEEKDDQVEKLQDQLAVVKQELGTKNLARSNVEKVVKQLNQTLERAQKNQGQDQEKLQEYQTTITKLTEQLHIIQQEKAEKENVATNLELELKEVVEDNIKKKSSQSHSKKVIEHLAIDLTTMRESISKYHDRCSQDEITINGLIDKLRIVQQQKTEKDKVATILEVKLKEVEEDNIKRKSDQIYSEKVFEHLAIDLTTMRESISKYHDKCSQDEITINGLTEKLRIAQQQITTTDQQTNEYETSLNKYEQEHMTEMYQKDEIIQNLRTDLIQNGEKLEQTKASLTQAELVIHQLNAELAQSQKSLGDVENQISKHGLIITTLRNNLNVTQQQLLQNDIQAQKTQMDLATLQEEQNTVRNALQEGLAQTKEILAVKTSALSDAHGLIDQLGTELQLARNIPREDDHTIVQQQIAMNDLRQNLTLAKKQIITNEKKAKQFHMELALFQASHINKVKNLHSIISAQEKQLHDSHMRKLMLYGQLEQVREWNSHLKMKLAVQRQAYDAHARMDQQWLDSDSHTKYEPNISNVSETMGINETSKNSVSRTSLECVNENIMEDLKCNLLQINQEIDTHKWDLCHAKHIVESLTDDLQSHASHSLMFDDKGSKPNPYAKKSNNAQQEFLNLESEIHHQDDSHYYQRVLQQGAFQMDATHDKMIQFKR